MKTPRSNTIAPPAPPADSAGAVSDPQPETAPAFAEPPDHLSGISRAAWRARNEEYVPAETAPEWLRRRVNGERARIRLESKGLAVVRLEKQGLLVRVA